MLSKNPAEPLPQAPAGPQAGAAPGDAAVLDPHSKIEVASSGNGTVNDPSASDTKPPGIADCDLLV